MPSEPFLTTDNFLEWSSISSAMSWEHAELAPSRVMHTASYTNYRLQDRERKPLRATWIAITPDRSDIDDAILIKDARRVGDGVRARRYWAIVDGSYPVSEFKIWQAMEEPRGHVDRGAHTHACATDLTGILAVSAVGSELTVQLAHNQG